MPSGASSTSCRYSFSRRRAATEDIGFVVVVVVVGLGFWGFFGFLAFLDRMVLWWGGIVGVRCGCAGCIYPYVGDSRMG